MDIKTSALAETQAIWFRLAHVSQPPLAQNLEIEIAIIGAGIMGLTAALELAKAGRRVAVFERRFIGAGETGHTTAHLTARPDVPMVDLQKRFGADGVTSVWQAMNTALEYIETSSQAHGVPFARVDAWQFGTPSVLSSELRVLNLVGANASISQAPSGFSFESGLCITQQARFDVAQYLQTLLLEAKKRGVVFFEKSAVIDSDTNSLTVRSESGTYKVSCQKQIIATHIPIFANPLLLVRMVAEQSYAIAVAVKSGSVPDVLAEDTEDPYHYYRIEPAMAHESGDEDIIIFGGQDHKTGKSADPEPFIALQQRLKKWLPTTEQRLIRQWSGEIWTSNDGLPIIDEDHQGRFFATGFAGVGMTQGTMAGLMASDWASEKPSAWRAIFSSSRFSSSDIPTILEHGIAIAGVMIEAALPKKLPALESTTVGVGGLIQHDQQHLAAYRDLNSKLHLFDPKCTHAGCELHWNLSDKTWDCGCHGSRFTALGEVRAGPALEPMKPWHEPTS